MFNETAVVISADGQPIYWHLPEGRSAVYLPDSKFLWDVIWEARHTLGGVAHTHPGRGPTGPSQEDITTFSAVELALGKRLTWWIATEDHLCVCTWTGPGKYDYAAIHTNEKPWQWLYFLRVLSKTDTYVDLEQEK